MSAQHPPRPPGLDAPWVTRAIKYSSRAHVWIYQRSGGRIGRYWRIMAGFRKPVPTLLLHHVGRTSGKAYVTPLIYLEDGPDLVVVASQGGLPKDPQWYHNLLAQPRVAVQVGRQRREVIARAASPAEREHLWPKLIELYADFDTYQSWTERQIPVVILSPA